MPRGYVSITDAPRFASVAFPQDSGKRRIRAPFHFWGLAPELPSVVRQGITQYSPILFHQFRRLLRRFKARRFSCNCLTNRREILILIGAGVMDRPER